MTVQRWSSGGPWEDVDVVRTQMHIVDRADAERVGIAHAELPVRPH